MFRVVPPPIIRSIYNCIYSIWYLSHRYCYRPLSWKGWNNSSTILTMHGPINVKYIFTVVPHSPHRYPRWTSSVIFLHQRYESSSYLPSGISRPSSFILRIVNTINICNSSMCDLISRLLLQPSCSQTLLSSE